jgi:ubiquitin-protein ligase E3 A
MVCKGQFLFTFDPEELELMICGSPNLDFKALEKATVYEDGYTASSTCVKYFW